MTSTDADPGLSSLRRVAIEIHAAATRDPEAGGRRIGDEEWITFLKSLLGDLLERSTGKRR